MHINHIIQQERKYFQIIILIDSRQSPGEQVVENLNNEFGRKRAIFLHCDVTNNSEFDGKYIYKHIFHQK